MNNKELESTVKLMLSDDYKDRFKAEYLQLEARYLKLLSMVEKWDRNELNFVPTCPRATYSLQLEAMRKYLDILLIRAKIENINLD